MFSLQNVFVGTEGVRMAFSPNESSQDGGGLLVIAFSDESPLKNGANYYIAFEGSYLRHLVTAKQINPLTFHSHIPEHRVAETVQLSVMMTRDGSTKILASSGFKYLPDPVERLAEFLLGSVYDPRSLENVDQLKAEFRDVFWRDDSDADLDRKLSRCLSKMTLPDGWHMLGINSHNPVPQETLLHFCARLGLRSTAQYLVALPGGQDAACLPNIEDDTPSDLSCMYGNLDMTELFQGKVPCDCPWLEAKISASPTRIQRVDPDVFVITSNLRESKKTLYDDLALMQEVCLARSQPPTVLTGLARRSYSNVEPPTHPIGVATSRRSSASNPRMRSKSDDVGRETVEEYDEKDPEFAFGGCHENHCSRQLYGVHSEPSRTSGYQEYRCRREQARYYRNNNSPAAHPVAMESIQKTSNDAWHQNSSVSASYYGNNEYRMNAGKVPAEWEKPVLEESLCKLQEIRTNLQQRLRESSHYNTVISEEEERKENLQRFSTSCPALPDSLTLQQEEDESSNQDSGELLGSHDRCMPGASQKSENYVSEPAFRYVPRLSDMSAGQRDVAATMAAKPASSSPPPSSSSGDRLQGDTTPHSRQDITIRINDVTVESTDDYVVPPGGADQTNAALIEQIKKANKRRSSWCPEEGRKKEEKHEKQKMLNISGRSQSLSSLDGDSDEDDDDEDDDASSSASYQNVPSDAVQTSYGTPTSCSPGVAATLSSGAPTSASSVSMTVQGHVTSDDLSESVISGSTASLNVSNSVASSVHTMSPANGHVSHSGPASPGDHCFSPSDDPNILMYPNILAKASSSPSIATEHHHDNKEIHNLECTDHNKGFSHQSGEDETEDDGDSRKDWFCTQSHDTVLEHPDVPLGADEEEDQPKTEKKRKSSVFSKLGSYRQKNKVIKDAKLLRNNTHQFVGVCFSNSTPCDVCSKSMSNKLALQCENCMVNVHENSCKDQIAICAKYKAARVANGEGVKEKKSSSLPAECATNNVNLKSSQSLKEARRAISVPAHPVLQSSGPVNVSAPRASSPSRAINEERDKTKDEEPVQSSVHFLDTNTITDAMSASIESLEEGSGLVVDIDEDFVDEREAWSVTVDKKTLKKMSAKDIKRQDHIWELIQTERSHCRTLKIMQTIFSHGMRHEVSMSQDMIDRIFPCLSELIDIHTTFLHRLTERQSLRPDRSIDEIGDILLQQFDGEMGERMKVAYGDFCSQHAMAVQLYKDILKSDRKFQNFIKKCSRSAICKRLSIPECILLVTQRVTKYPLLIEPIVKTTKDSKSDKELVLRALPLMRQILVYIDAQVDAHEKEQRLIEIYNKLDARSYAMYMGKKFKKSNLLDSRKLIHEGYLRWMTARGKSFEVLAVILSDVMFFLAENNQKFTFFSQDSKCSVVPLSKLLVREKGDTRDSKGIYLIWQSKTEPEMYEFICRSAEERKTWIKVIRAAVLKCMEVEGIDITKRPEIEGEKKELEAKSARIRQLVDRLYERDGIIKQKCDEKMAIIVEMLEVFCKEEINKNLQTVYKEEAPDNIDHNVWSTLKHTVQDSSQFLSMVLLGNSEMMLAHGAGHRHSQTDNNVCVSALPRRAETFSGFDQKEKVKRRYDVDELSENSRSGSQLSLNETESTPQTAESSHNDRRGSSRKEKTKGQNSNLLQGLIKTNTPDAEADRLSPDPESHDASHDLAHKLAARLQELVTGPSKEQCECLAQLMQYLYGLVCITSSQLTEVEKLRAQLSEANSKVSTLYAENKRLSHGFHHDKQLEILREQQESLHQERTELDRLREFDRKEREEEREKIEKQKEQIEKEKAELQSQKEEIQRQKEILQRQMDLFEENKRRLLQQTTDSPKGLGMRERSESPASRGVSPSSRGSQSSLLEMSHRRSGSDDVSYGPSPDHVMDGGGGTNPVPIHLLSATNEQKIGPVSQQLPLKLAVQSSSKLPQPPSLLSGAASKQQSPSGVQQMLPFRLSSSALSSQSGPKSQSSEPSILHTTTQQMLSKSATLDSATRSLTHSQLQRPPVSVGRTSSGTRMPVGAANISPHGNILPMKLAEKPRPKSASSASSSAMATHHGSTAGEKSHSHKRSSSGAKKVGEITYF